MNSNRPLYERDFYAWANEQAALLRAGRLDELDVENIAEEVEAMARSEKRELINRLVVLLHHLLKWQFQPRRRSRSWRLTIKEQRVRLARHLDENPSLKLQLDDAIAQAYELAVIKVEQETRLTADALPEHCPWSFEEIVARDWLPDEANSEVAIGE